MTPHTDRYRRIAQDEQYIPREHCLECGTELTPEQLAIAQGASLCGDCRAASNTVVIP